MWHFAAYQEKRRRCFATIDRATTVFPFLLLCLAIARYTRPRHGPRSAMLATFLPGHHSFLVCAAPNMIGSIVRPAEVSSSPSLRRRFSAQQNSRLGDVSIRFPEGLDHVAVQAEPPRSRHICEILRIGWIAPCSFVGGHSVAELNQRADRDRPFIETSTRSLQLSR